MDLPMPLKVWYYCIVLYYTNLVNLVDCHFQRTYQHVLGVLQNGSLPYWVFGGDGKQISKGGIMNMDSVL